MTRQILVLNGPNLNLLGTREPEIYGTDTLADIIGELRTYATTLAVAVRDTQSNSEGALIDALHEARGWADAVVFNPGAYTHYSYALRDAITACELPVVETHLSDPSTREAFRHVSVLAEVCIATVAGLGKQSYFVALDTALAHLEAS